jgi:HTH-type transcriptional regulator / antitoxin HigA
MNIKPIKSKQDYELALSRIDELWDAEPNTSASDELDVLTTLVEAYEQKVFEIEAPDPVAAIKFRMEQQGLVASDLINVLGQRSRVSEVLNKKRKLSIAMIRSLHKELKIPLNSLISDYNLSNS